MPPKAEKKNNGFDRLRADLKAQTPQNVYLFYGEETYLRSYYLEELHRLLIPAGFEEFNYHRLSGKGLTVQELAEVTEAMPMMAQHTMVVVTDLDIFRLDEQQRTALMALLADFPEYCTLVLVYDLLPYKRDGKMKKLCAALDKSVCEVEFRQQERAQLLRWVKRRFAAAGHDIDDATADQSCEVRSSVFLISDEEDCISWLKSCKVFDFSLEFFWNKFINWSLVASVFKNLKVSKSAHSDSCSELK